MKKFTIEDLNKVVNNFEEVRLPMDDKYSVRVSLTNNYRTNDHCVQVSIMDDDVGYCITSYYYPNECATAIINYVNNFVVENDKEFDDDSWSMVDISILEMGLYPVARRSHYDYLNSVIERFWVKVFDKTMDEMWCSAIVIAHGDKCEGYKYEWSDLDIPFFHGVLLYLLTYTKIMDMPKHESSEWVVKNYERFKPMILEAEEEFMNSLIEKANLQK